MKKSSIVFATVGALALTGFAMTKPAEARGGFRPDIAAGAIAGAAIGAGVGYGAYAAYGGPGYYAGPSPYAYGSGGYYPYAGYDQSQHGGQPYDGQ